MTHHTITKQTNKKKNTHPFSRYTNCTKPSLLIILTLISEKNEKEKKNKQRIYLQNRKADVHSLTESQILFSTFWILSLFE